MWLRFQTESLIFPKTLDDALRAGTAIVGSPASVRDRIRHDLAASGSNYLVGRFAFRDLSLERLLHCVELFSAEVMPSV